MQDGRKPDPLQLNYGMFSHEDLVNIVLQRSEILHDIKSSGQKIRAWEDGDASELDAIVTEKSEALAMRAASVIQDEFEVLRPIMDPISPKSIADIGCGYAFFDLFAHKAYDCDLLLVDIEENERRHFGFNSEGAAYTSLSVARSFLVGNGVPDQHITTWNPQSEELGEVERVDVALSLLSCGFHYPVDMYMPFFRFGVRKGGKIILDLRIAQFSQISKTLSVLGEVETIATAKDRRRVVVHKGRKT